MILGHQKQISFLKKIVDSGRIPHAFLFSGQEKLGKKTVAIEFARWILKENPFSHPDFLLVEPEGDIIPIQKIREISYHLSLTPLYSKYKILVLDSAHLMNLEAQNCFLKTLEEPKGNSVIILITQLPEMLLPTIRSRCQEIKFFPLKKIEIESFLQDKNIQNRKKILEICQGRPGVLFELLKDPKKMKEIERIEKILAKLPQKSILERFNYLKTVGFNEFFESFLLFFSQNLLREPIKSSKILNLALNLYFLSLNSKVDKRMLLELLVLSI